MSVRSLCWAVTPARSPAPPLLSYSSGRPGPGGTCALRACPSARIALGSSCLGGPFPGLALPPGCLACPLNERVSEKPIVDRREGWHEGEGGGWDWGCRDGQCQAHPPQPGVWFRPITAHDEGASEAWSGSHCHDTRRFPQHRGTSHSHAEPSLFD